MNSQIFCGDIPHVQSWCDSFTFSTLVSIFYCWPPTSTIASQRKYLLWCAGYPIPMLSLYDRAAKHPQYHTTNKYSSLNWSSTSIRIHACSNVSFSFHIHSNIKCLHFIFKPGLSKCLSKFQTFSKERNSKQDLLTFLQLNYVAYTSKTMDRQQTLNLNLLPSLSRGISAMSQGNSAMAFEQNRAQQQTTHKIFVK